MTINQIKTKHDALNKVQQAQLKGGTNAAATVNTIIIEDIDVV